MLNIFQYRGAFYNDWIGNPLPVILYGIGNEGKLWLDKLSSLNIKVEKVCDNFYKGTYKSYEVEKLASLKSGISYMILITVNDKIQQYQMIQELRTNGIEGSIYIDSAFKEFDFYIQEIGIVDFRKTIPWFYESAYQIKVNRKNMEEWLPSIPLLMSPKGYYYRGDYSSGDFNIKDGCRYTVDTPVHYKNCISVFGDSRMFGPCLRDRDTICSKLQIRLNKEKIKSKVINYSVNPNTIKNIWARLQDIELNEGDIVVVACLSISVRKTDLDKLEDNVKKNSRLSLQYIKKINRYCIEHKVKLYVIEVGSCYDIKNKWLSEFFLLEAAKKRPFWDEEQYVLSIDVQWLKEECQIEDINYLDYKCIIQRPHDYGEIFIDSGHFGPNGCRLVANAMFNDIFCEPQKEKQNLEMKYEQVIRACDKWLVFPFIESKEYKEFMELLKSYKMNGKEKIGSIVMNANPFTNGHRYLVECAARQVDWLFVMVVQEDKSEFSFLDRIEMVRLGTEDLENVTVLRSGKFVISSYTFPDYFDPVICDGGERDINIFANLIAPSLNIKYRFIGSEPFSKVTDNYNKVMMRMLPEFGIECVEIERCEDMDGNTISASEVRRRIKNMETESIKKLVPETTYTYLQRLL